MSFPGHLYIYHDVKHYEHVVFSHTLGMQGGGPGAVGKAACLQTREIMGSSHALHSSFKETKCFFPAHS